MTQRYLVLFLAALASLSGCGNTTGSGLVTFTAQAGGPSDITPGGPLQFETGSGFQISLTMAHFHLGAIYLNMSVPASGGPSEPCILPGQYVGQAMGSCDPTTNVCGVDLDLLDPTLVTFPLPGQGTADPAVEADVWLTGGDINAEDDSTPILQVAGTASKGMQSWPFTATVTIGQNRAVPVQNVSMPGAYPICHQRIASLIPINFTMQNGGTLVLRVDPRGMFNAVDFTTLTLMTGMNPPYVIPDQSGGAGGALYEGVLANSGVYDFTWLSPGQ
jgi:hypothetical protein